MADGTLGVKLKEELLDALLATPGTDDRAGRTALLSGIPPNVRSGLNRTDNAFVDLTNVLDQLDKLGRLDNGERPIVIVLQNARRMSRGTDLGRTLQQLVARAEEAYGGDVPLPELPDTPEALLFGGTGEWVTGAFMEQAQLAGRRVARLLVPRFAGGACVSPVGSTGTGWLVAPRLVLTNHHVIHARRPDEPPASDADVGQQGAAARAWFDYHVEGVPGATVAATEVVSSSRALDYALLRLADAPELAGRGQLPVARTPAVLVRGARLNIVQCPGGGPLRFAIRNNFYVGPGETSHKLRYLTDTHEGSSGSPVLDDTWQVVAMHRGFKKVNPELTKLEAGQSEVVKFHNEGIAIHDILAELPEAARKEIQDAQGWDVAR